MFFRDKKQEKVLRQIDEFCRLIGECVDQYAKMIDDYLDADKQFKEESQRVHELEGAADKLRFSMEREMYRGAFLPAYREDFIGLLEKLDRVANKAEDSADLIYLVRPVIPERVGQDLREIARLTLKAWAPIPTMVHKTLHDEHDVQDDVVKIGRLEKRVDQIQFNAVRRVYKSRDIEKFDKLILKMVIDQVSEVSDRIENVGDRTSIIAIKRQMG